MQIKNVKAAIGFVLVVFTLVASCKKKDSNGNFALQVTYQSGGTVNVNIYASRADLYKNANAIFTGRTNTVSKVVIPGSLLQSGQTYYVDAYTDDCGSHSLYNGGDSFVYVGGTPFMSLPGTYTGADPTYIRNALSNNNTTLTTNWEAYDAISIDTSTDSYVIFWKKGFGVSNKDRSLTFNKDFTGVYTYKDSLGTAVDKPFSYFVSQNDININGIGFGSQMTNGADSTNATFYFQTDADGPNVYYRFKKVK